MIASNSRVLLLVMTDGRRECIAQTIPSARENLFGKITRCIIFDDSGDEHYRAWLRKNFPEYEVAWHPAGRQGFGGAIRAAWSYVGVGPEPYVFHLEDDFVFNRPVSLEPMIESLEYQPHLSQLAFRRQPWNNEERAAGGVVEQHPDAYRDAGCCPEHQWLEHRLFFTTNPSLYRRSLTLAGWPDVEHSEGAFSHQLLDDPDLRFGFWGGRASGEWVTHIGRERVGTGY